jgi:hypothetical protein
MTQNRARLAKFIMLRNLQFVYEVCQREVLSQSQTLEALNATMVGLVAVEVGISIFVIEQLVAKRINDIVVPVVVIIFAIWISILAIRARHRERPDLLQLADVLSSADPAAIREGIGGLVKVYDNGVKIMRQKGIAIWLPLIVAVFILLVYALAIRVLVKP